MSSTLSEPPPAVTLVDTPRTAATGYVEAMTETAVLGWAWTPGQAEPLVVELRLGAQVVAEAPANELREDLARSGIGAGRHAFTLAVPARLRPRMTELRVFARTAEGAAVPLGRPPVEDGLAERLGQLQRGMEVLAGSQRVLHRNVQAALLGQGQGAIEPTAAIAATQAELKEAIATLELFVVRVEQGLAGLAVPPVAAAAPRLLLGIVAGVAGLALVTALGVLVRVWPVQ